MSRTLKKDHLYFKINACTLLVRRGCPYAGKVAGSQILFVSANN